MTTSNKYPGVYRGVVKSVNADGIRLKAQVPAVLGKALSAWAVPSVAAGTPPVVGTVVFVAFDKGDLNRPIYFVGGSAAAPGGARVLDRVTITYPQDGDGLIVGNGFYFDLLTETGITVSDESATPWFELDDINGIALLKENGFYDVQTYFNFILEEGDSVWWSSSFNYAPGQSVGRETIEVGAVENNLAGAGYPLTWKDNAWVEFGGPGGFTSDYSTPDDITPDGWSASLRFYKGSGIDDMLLRNYTILLTKVT